VVSTSDLSTLFFCLPSLSLLCILCWPGTQLGVLAPTQVFFAGLSYLCSVHHTSRGLTLSSFDLSGVPRQPAPHLYNPVSYSQLVLVKSSYVSVVWSYESEGHRAEESYLIALVNVWPLFQESPLAASLSQIHLSLLFVPLPHRPLDHLQNRKLPFAEISSLLSCIDMATSLSTCAWRVVF